MLLEKYTHVVLVVAVVSVVVAVVVVFRKAPSPILFVSACAHLT